jgi:hypothetical protein
MMEKFPAEIAGKTFAVQIQSAHVPLELVASSVEEKSAWVKALTELAALSDDTGTEVLLVQKRSADVNAVSLFCPFSLQDFNQAPTAQAKKRPETLNPRPGQEIKSVLQQSQRDPQTLIPQPSTLNPEP